MVRAGILCFGLVLRECGVRLGFLVFSYIRVIFESFVIIKRYFYFVFF